MSTMKLSPAEQKMLKEIRTIVDSLPESAEVEAWGHPTFRAGKKMFAAFGGAYHGEGPTLGMKVGFDRQEELLEDDKRFYPTPYAAHQGWVSLRLTAKTKWKEVRGLLVEAYRQVANKRMLKALDE